MLASEILHQALSVISGRDLIGSFVANKDDLNKIANSCERLSLWANAIMRSDPYNAANPFLLEMQRSSHDVAVLLACALYVPAAASMRSCCEAALHYTYFRSHPAELTTLVKDPKYYISKTDVIEFHKQHSEVFQNTCRHFGLPGSLDQWYSQISSIVHGQLPGTWGKRLALEDTQHDTSTLFQAIKTFQNGVEIINTLMLTSVAPELWGRFHHEVKKVILKGMIAEQRSILGLDGKC